MDKTMKAHLKLNSGLSVTGFFLLVLITLMMRPLTASAAQNTGSLTLQCVFSVEGGERILVGDEYAIVKIAAAKQTEGGMVYTTETAFSRFDCDWLNTASSDLNRIAEDLTDFSQKNQLFTAFAVTDNNGELSFGSLEIGLYLVARTKTAPANERFETDPLLAFIPEEVDGNVIYDVTATPKFSYHSPASDPALPQTGLLLWPVTVLAVLGCLLIICGSFLLRKEHDSEK